MRMIKIIITKFQKKVYAFVKTIPKGKTATYKEVAVTIWYPRAYRAGGNALNHNPQIGIIPCHRVVKSNGQIGGFALGAHKKVKLLQEERIV